MEQNVFEKKPLLKSSENFGLRHLAKQPSQTVTAEWEYLSNDSIQDVMIKEIKNVILHNGCLTELFRPEWIPQGFTVRHVVHVAMLPKTTSSWHCHFEQNDLIICIRGQLKIGLYDDRLSSSTHSKTSVINVSNLRPTLLQVPTGVWHAIKNPASDEAAYIVLNDQPFNYEQPDDWILPSESDVIPLKW